MQRLGVPIRMNRNDRKSIIPTTRSPDQICLIFLCIDIVLLSPWPRPKVEVQLEGPLREPRLAMGPCLPSLPSGPIP